MPRISFTKDELVRIRTFLELGWSFSVIQRKLAKEGKSISIAYLSKLKNAEDRHAPCMHSRKQRRGRFRTFTPQRLATLKRLVSTTNPPTQRDLARRFHCSQPAISKAIKWLDLRIVKKPKSHALTADTIEKRRRRSWPLYLRLRGDRWRNYITTDEAWVYLSDTGRRRSVQYISREKRRSDAEVQVHVAHPRGVMVWVAISANGVSRPFFIDPGAKINAAYYQTSVLEPFFTREVQKMYPTGNYVFHQDSAPSHKAKSTLKWFEDRGISFIPPQKWMPSSPDAAPCDYFLWGYLKSRLNAKRPRTVQGLKRAITECLREIPQEMVNRALLAWPKRCRQVYYARGSHIEKYRK